MLFMSLIGVDEMKKLFLLLFVPFGSLMCADTNLAISWSGPERVILKAQLFH